MNFQCLVRNTKNWLHGCLSWETDLTLEASEDFISGESNTRSETAWTWQGDISLHREKGVRNGKLGQMKITSSFRLELASVCLELSLGLGQIFPTAMFSAGLDGCLGLCWDSSWCAKLKLNLKFHWKKAILIFYFTAVLEISLFFQINVYQYTVATSVMS